MPTNRDYYLLKFGNHLSSDVIDDASKIGDGENVFIRDKDYYKKFQEVHDKFTNPDTGTFDDKAYDKYYNKTLGEFNQFSHVRTALSNVQDPVLDTPENRAAGFTNFVQANAHFRADNRKDLLNRTVGYTGYNEMSKPTESIYEIAQRNKLRDANGKELDITTEDHGFWGNVITPTTLDRYMEDGVDSEGNKVKKGDLRLINGQAGYRLLKDGEDTTNLEIESSWNLITKEGSFANKFDFMDSDDLEKSITGTIFKTAAQIVPYFIPYYGQVHTFLNVGGNILDAAATINKVVRGFVYDEGKAPESEMTKWLDKQQARWASLGVGTTMESRESIFTFENLGGLAASSISQLYGQRGIAAIPQLIKKGKLTNFASKSLATTYMAATSAKDVYSGAKKIGATDAEASLLYTGLFAGLTALFNSPVGNWAIKHLDDAAVLSHNAIVKNLPKQGAKIIQEGGEAAAKQRKFFNLGKSISDTMHEMFVRPGATMARLRGSAGTKSALLAASQLEGAEEVSELALQKSLEGLYNGYKSLGLGDKKSENARFKFDKLGEEAIASFIGGAIGGAIFKGHDRLKGESFDNQDFKDLIINGNKDILLRTLESLRKRGKLGNTNLSMTLDENGNFKPYNEGDIDKINQNEFAYKSIRNLIDSYNAIIEVNDLPLTSDVAAEYQKRYDKDIKTDKDFRYNLLVEVDRNTTLKDDLGRVFSDLIDVSEKLKSMTTPEGETISQEAVQKYESERNQLLKQANDIKTGALAHDYYQQGLFNLNTPLSKMYGVKTKNNFINVNEYNRIRDEINNISKDIVDRTAAGEPVTDNDKVKLASKYKELEDLETKASTELAEYKASGQDKEDFRKAFKTFQDELRHNTAIQKIKDSNLNEVANDLAYAVGEGGYYKRSVIDSQEQNLKEIEKILNKRDLELELDTDAEGNDVLKVNGVDYTVDQFKTFVGNIQRIDSSLVDELSQRFEKTFNEFLNEEFDLNNNRTKIMGAWNLDKTARDIIKNGTIDELADEIFENFDLYNLDETIEDPAIVAELLRQKETTFKALKRILNFSSILDDADLQSLDVDGILDSLFAPQENFITNQFTEIKNKGAGLYVEPSETIQEQLDQIAILRRNLLVARDITPLSNSYAKATGNTHQDPEITTASYGILHNAVNSLEDRLNYLLRLSEINRADLLMSMQRSDKKLIGLQGKVINNLLTDIPALNDKVNYSEYPNLSAVINGLDDEVRIEDALPELVAVETQVYEAYKDNKADIDAYIDKHYFSKEAYFKYKGLSDSDTELPPVIAYNYLNTITRANSSEFYNLYKKSIEKKGIAPIYNQELILKQIYAFLVGGSDRSFIKRDDGRYPYMDVSSSTIALKNFIFAQATHGAGKSSVVIPFTVDMYKANPNLKGKVYVTAPYSRQVDNLKDVVKDVEFLSSPADAVSLLAGDMSTNLLALIEEDLTVDNYKSINDKVRALAREKEGYIRGSFNNDQMKNVGTIIMDEATQINNALNIYLDEIINIHNEQRLGNPSSNLNTIKVIAAGDPDQTGFTHRVFKEVDGKKVPSNKFFNLEFNTYLETSLLSQISLRGTYESFNNLNGQLKTLIGETYEKKDAFRLPTGEKRIQTDYFRGNNTGLVKVENLDQAIPYINRVLKDQQDLKPEEQIISNKNKVLIIHDNPETVNTALDKSLYEVVTPKEAQGSEANVVLLLATPSEDATDIEKLNFYNTHLNRALLLNVFRNTEDYFAPTNFREGDAQIHNRFRDKQGNLNEQLIEGLKESKIAMLDKILKVKAKETVTPEVEDAPLVTDVKDDEVDAITDVDEIEVIEKPTNDDREDEVEIVEEVVPEESFEYAVKTPEDAIEKRAMIPIEETKMNEHGATYDGVDKVEEKDDMRMYSFYAAMGDIKSIQKILPKYSAEEARNVLYGMKAKAMGVRRSIPTPLQGRRYNFAKAKLNLVGRPFTEDDINFAPTADERFMHNVGDPFLYYEMEIPSTLPKVEPFKMLMLALPRLANPVPDKSGNPTDNTVEKSMLYKGMPGVVGMLKVFENEVRSEGELSYEVPKEDVAKILNKESIKNGTFIKAPEGELIPYTEFLRDNQHLSTAVVVYTGYTGKEPTLEQENIKGVPIMLWSYETLTKDQLANAFLNPSSQYRDLVGTVKLQGQNLTVEELTQGFSDHKNYRELLNPRSLTIINKIFWDHLDKRLATNPAFSTTEDKIARLAKVLHNNGKLSDPNDPTQFTSGGNVANFEIKALLDALATASVGNFLVNAYNSDEDGSASIVYNMRNDAKDIIKGLDGIISRIPDPYRRLSYNLVVDNSVAEKGSNKTSVIGGVRNEEDLVSWVKFISPSESIVKTGDLESLIEFNEKAKADEIKEEELRTSFDPVDSVPGKGLQAKLQAFIERTNTLEAAAELHGKYIGRYRDNVYYFDFNPETNKMSYKPVPLSEILGNFDFTTENNTVRAETDESITEFNLNTGEVKTYQKESEPSEYDTWLNEINGLEGGEQFLENLVREDFAPDKEFQEELFRFMINNPDNIDTIEKIIEHNCRK